MEYEFSDYSLLIKPKEKEKENIRYRAMHTVLGVKI